MKMAWAVRNVGGKEPPGDWRGDNLVTLERSPIVCSTRTGERVTAARAGRGKSHGAQAPHRSMETSLQIVSLSLWRDLWPIMPGSPSACPIP
jgi:hypothetical protein